MGYFDNAVVPITCSVNGIKYTKLNSTYFMYQMSIYMMHGALKHEVSRPCEHNLVYSFSHELKNMIADS